MNLCKTAAIACAVVALLFTWPAASQPPAKAATSTASHSPWVKTHRVVIQVTQSDPAVMNLALNNAENLVNYYKEKGEKIEIEFVAYGAGLAMMRSDTSPVKDRLTAIAANMKNVTFTGCGNTLGNQSKQENKTLTLVPEARLVPAGIARIVELEEEGWSYVRP
jgi:intracellular sulfur oxidation DsrE/DsrF family protein